MSYIEIKGKKKKQNLKKIEQYIIPSTIYSKKIKISNIVCLIRSNDLKKKNHENNIFSSIIIMKVKEKKFLIIASYIQNHPVSEKLLHVDFTFVKKNVPIKIAVKIQIMNNEKCIGLKKGGKLNIIKKSITLISLPSNTIKYININIQKLTIGDSIKTSDIKLPYGINYYKKKKQILLNIIGRSKEQENTEKEKKEEVSKNE